jgi:hypothetical protein
MKSTRWTILLSLALSLAAMTGAKAADTTATNKPAGPAAVPPSEPVSPDDFAFLDQGKTIPWATPQTADAFVAYLKSLPVTGIDHQMPILKLPRDRFHDNKFTYEFEVAPNIFSEVIESRAAPIAFF